MISIAEGNLNYSDHKSVYIHGTTHILYMCTVLSVCLVIGGKMQDYFLESLKLQRIDFLSSLWRLVSVMMKRSDWLSSGFLS